MPTSERFRRNWTRAAAAAGFDRATAESNLRLLATQNGPTPIEVPRAIQRVPATRPKFSYVDHVRVSPEALSLEPTRSEHVNPSELRRSERPRR
jgi:hypothetical protein